MDLHYLKLFYAVATHLSLSKAAEHLHISQPAVSIQIKKLEEALGLKLFDRMGRQVYLTQAGQILYGYASQIFDLVEQAKAELYSLKGTIWGSVQVGASNTPGIYILPRILGQYKKQYPDVVSTLRIANTYEIENMLYHNQLDFAVIGGGVTRKDVFHVEKLMEDEMVLIVGANHPLAFQNVVKPQDLKDEEYITHEHNSALFKAVSEITEDLGFPFSRSISMGSIDAIKQAVSANLGVTIVPRIAVELDLKMGLLKEIKVKNKKWRYSYHLVYHKGKQFAPAVEKLLETCQQYMKELRGEEK